MERRHFIKSAVAAAGLSSAPLFTAATAPQVEAVTNKKVKKGLGYGMITADVSLLDKFKMAKDTGFDGIEFNAPVDIPVRELLDAKEKTGIELPSVVNKDHWAKPLSDPDPKVRQACIESVARSLEEVKALGGDTALVVPGVVNDKAPYEQAYNTALDSIRKLIPFVEKTGIHIGLENVWSNFILSPVEARNFVDEINHPLIGWYFDIGNVLRYGWPEHWIKTLNSRIVKLHVKEFSREIMNTKGLRSGFDVELLEGDNNWPAVMKAVSEINYRGGWITAEVGGGDKAHLKKISGQMDKILAYMP
ncbi:MAG: sugar phosphate isomerase/epimerase [Tannerellaceae bacterium]|jgi:hexulose-6-phosphate isomerase|nr:sugar phosphate isomerase/epimerase [Tannerellaceae bacterium]